MGTTSKPLILKDGKKKELGSLPEFIRGLELFEYPDQNIEITRTGILVTAVEFFISPTKLTSERRSRQEITYSGIQANQVDTFYYDTDGTTVIRQVRETLTYSGVLLTDTRTVEII
jgi:hypothetical protein